VNCPSSISSGSQSFFLDTRLFHRPLDALGELGEVAHAEQSGDEPVRFEPFDILDLLAGAQERDRGIRLIDGSERPTTFCRPVEFRNHDAVDADRFVELLGLVFRPLPDGRVEHQQPDVRVDDVLDILDFVDQVLLESVSTSGVDDVDVGLARRFEALTGDLDRVLTVGIAIKVDFGTATHLFRLVVRARTEGVGLDHCRPESLRREPPGHLRGGRRLPRPLESRQENRLFLEGEFRGLTDEVDEFLVDDTENEIPRRCACGWLFLE